MSGPKTCEFSLAGLVIGGAIVGAGCVVVGIGNAMVSARNNIIEQERLAKEKLRQEMNNKMSELDSAMAAEKKRFEKKLFQETVSVEVVQKKKLLENSEIEETAPDFEQMMRELRKEVEIPQFSQEDITAIFEEVYEEPIEGRGLLDIYDIKYTEDTLDDMVDAPDEEEKNFNDLLLKMEEEYQDILTDRAFFKYQKERIINFEKVCRRQKEYHSYQMLKNVYYNEFKMLREARTTWHMKYEKWHEKFVDAYSVYRAMCQMLGRTPLYYRMNVDTVEADIAQMEADTRQLENEYIEKQKALEITRIFNEVMEEMGYEVLGTKSVTKKSGDVVNNTVFSYGEGSGIHVMDSNGRITMEVVGIEDEKRELSDEEKDYLVGEQENFCDSYAQIQKELEKRGVVVKKKIKMSSPSREYSDIMSMEGYTCTESKAKVKKLSSVNKKEKKKLHGTQKMYMSQE